MMNDLICTHGVCLANSSFLREMLAYKHADIRLNTKVSEIYEDGVKVVTKDGKEDIIKCDDVIVSIGYKPAPLTTGSKHVHLVGDCNEVGNLRTVIWRAWDVAMKL